MSKYKNSPGQPRPSENSLRPPGYGGSLHYTSKDIGTAKVNYTTSKAIFNNLQDSFKVLGTTKTTFYGEVKDKTWTKKGGTPFKKKVEFNDKISIKMIDRYIEELKEEKQGILHNPEAPTEISKNQPYRTPPVGPRRKGGTPVQEEQGRNGRIGRCISRRNVRSPRSAGRGRTIRS